MPYGPFIAGFAKHLGIHCSIFLITPPPLPTPWDYYLLSTLRPRKSMTCPGLVTVKGAHNDLSLSLLPVTNSRTQAKGCTISYLVTTRRVQTLRRWLSKKGTNKICQYRANPSTVHIIVNGGRLVILLVPVIQP